MSNIYTSKEVDAAVAALVAAYNALQQATVSASTDGYHRGITGVAGGDWSNPTSSNLQVTAAAASSLSTSAALALNVQGVMGVHFADAVSHLLADDVNVGFKDGYEVTDNTGAFDLTKVCALLNAEKLCFNAHLTQSGVHLKSDTGNTVSAADATDQSSANTLANQLKAKVNSHITSGPTVPRIAIVG